MGWYNWVAPPLGFACSWCSIIPVVFECFLYSLEFVIVFCFVFVLFFFYSLRFNLQVNWFLIASSIVFAMIFPDGRHLKVTGSPLLSQGLTLLLYYKWDFTWPLYCKLKLLLLPLFCFIIYSFILCINHKSYLYYLWLPVNIMIYIDFLIKTQI